MTDTRSPAAAVVAAALAAATTIEAPLKNRCRTTCATQALPGDRELEMEAAMAERAPAMTRRGPATRGRV